MYSVLCASATLNATVHLAKVKTGMVCATGMGGLTVEYQQVNKLRYPDFLASLCWVPSRK